MAQEINIVKKTGEDIKVVVTDEPVKTVKISTTSPTSFNVHGNELVFFSGDTNKQYAATVTFVDLSVTTTTTTLPPTTTTTTSTTTTTTTLPPTTTTTTTTTLPPTTTTTTTAAPSTGKISYTINASGFHIAGVDQTNPVIYDNDMINDTPEMFFLWLKAHKGQVKLVGNINTRDMFIPPNLIHTHDFTFVDWTDAYNRAMATNLKNIPQPVKGAAMYLTKPANGVIEQTPFQNSVGADLIISEARKASAAKPLVIFVGGQVSTVAHAYLKANDIADKIIVLHVDGWDKTDYNSLDYWATEIVVRRMKYINWDGNFNGTTTTWYDPFRPIQGVHVNGIPNNSFARLYVEGFFNQAYAAYKDIGDAPPILWFFDNSLWKNAVRRTVGKQTTTSNTYDHLLISDNDWAKYGPMLTSYMVNPANYL